MQMYEKVYMHVYENGMSDFQSFSQMLVKILTYESPYEEPHGGFDKTVCVPHKPFL